MKRLRRWHLYLGCFFAPLLVFYVATGWYQTVTGDRSKGIGEADDLVSRLVSVHVDQIFPLAASSSFRPAGFRVLVVLMSVALLFSVATGLVLAFQAVRPRWIVWLLLILGIVIPVATLWLGQGR